MNSPFISNLMSATAGTTANSGTLDLGSSGLVSVQAIYTDATPGAKSFVAANVTPAADTITITAHGFFTGLKVALSGTNLPTGLSATNYWVIVVDANTIKLATSLANASAGTAVDITGAGTTADAALTPAALSGVIKLQASNDNTNFSDLTGATVTITAGGNTIWGLGQPDYRYLKTVFTPTTGALTYSTLCSSKQIQVAH